jgi:hypothetical protein
MTQIDEIVAERDCTKLIHNYFEMVNPLDTEGVLALFSETAVVERTGSRPMRLEGKGAIRQYLTTPQLQAKAYLAQNIIIDVLDDDNARGSCLAVVVSAQERPDSSLPSGKLHLILRYLDQFHKTEDGWRFSCRTVSRVFDNEGL